MHYRNGRPAKNGDKVIQLSIEGGKITGVGVLYDAVPGNDYCNGNLAPVQRAVENACLCDCIHVEDLAELLKAAGLDKRPAARPTYPATAPASDPELPANPPPSA